MCPSTDNIDLWVSRKTIVISPTIFTNALYQRPNSLIRYRPVMEASVADCDLEVLTAIETVYNLEEVKAKKISNKLPKNFMKN